MDGARLAARTLTARGVSTVFTLCGDHTNPLLAALEDEGVRLVDTRDERGAAWMAAGWALATTQPGVVVVSNTPALLNAAVALADADACGVPVLCITGGVGIGDRGTGHPGDRDQAAIAGPWTRWAAVVTSVDQTGDVLADAWDSCIGPPRGAAVVDLPLDLQSAATDREPPPVRPRARPLPAEPDLEAARAALSRAQRPVIIAGEGCFWADAGQNLIALIERRRFPVFTARAARGLVSDDHELCFGYPNLLAEPAQAIFGEADVALIVGARLDLALAGGGFSPDCTLIRIEESGSHDRLGRAADIQLVGHPAGILDALDGGERPTTSWLERLRNAEANRDAELRARAANGGAGALHPALVMGEIAQRLPETAMVCADAGEFALWAIDQIPARTPSGFNASSFSALGSLGMGLPWAIGMAAAEPARHAFVLAGDGSLGFTAMEIETAVRCELDLTVVVGNDAGWGIVRHLQDALLGRAIASDLPATDYAALARSLGATGVTVTTITDLRSELDRIPDGVRVIDVRIDATARHPALAMIEAMFATR